jgi:hypothetical protein
MMFSDGVRFNTSGKPRIVRKKDGLYVVGNGWLIPVDDIEEAKNEIKALNQTAEPKGGE